MDHVDAIIHIASLPALVGYFALNAPERIDEDGRIRGFISTPLVMQGAAALTYVRMTTDDAANFRTTPGVTILAERPYAGRTTADAVYAALFADPLARALYDAVYSRLPLPLPLPVEGGGGGEGGTMFTPPERFGAMS